MSWVGLRRPGSRPGFGHNPFEAFVTIGFPELLDHRFAHEADPANAFSVDTLIRPEELALFVLKIGFVLVRWKESRIHHSCPCIWKTPTNNRKVEGVLRCGEAIRSGHIHSRQCLDLMDQGRANRFGDSGHGVHDMWWNGRGVLAEVLRKEGIRDNAGVLRLARGSMGSGLSGTI